MAFESGLLTTLKVDLKTGMWVESQLVLGPDPGTNVQQPLLATRSVLELEDIHIHVAISMFL